MARLSFPTERRVRPPLLIDEQQIKGLDQIFDRYEERLAAYAEKHLDELTEAEIRRRMSRGLLGEDQVEARRPEVRELMRSEHFRRDGRSATIYLPGGREIQARHLSEAISQPVGEDEIAIGLRAYLCVGGVEATVGLVSEWREDLILEVEPSDPEIAQELFGALSNWASDIEAPTWQQKWSQYSWVFGGLLMLWIMVGVLSIPLSNWGDAGTNASKAEARKLLAQGMTQENQQHAVALLLAIESGYDPGTQAPPLGLRYWSYVSIGTLILIGTVIRPGICIGVWKGRKRLKRWRQWITTVTVTIPVLLVGSSLLPWLLHWLHLSPPTN